MVLLFIKNLVNALISLGTKQKKVIILVQNRIKVLRAERDWTQADLAVKAGISRQAIISIEKYKYTPSLELTYKIASVFDVSIDEVFQYRGGAINE